MQLLSEEELLRLLVADNKTLIRIMNATDFLAEVPFRRGLKGCTSILSVSLPVSSRGPVITSEIDSQVENPNEFCGFHFKLRFYRF